MKNLYTESSYDRNERPRAFPFYQDYQQNTYFAPNQGTEENLLFDPKGVSDPMNWGATPKFTREPTEAESRTLNQIQSLAFANVLNNSLVTLGKDPSQGLYLRQLIGQAAMQPVAVADEDINEAGIAREQTRLNDLMAQPEDRLQQSGMGDLITQSMSKLAYMKARHNNTLVIPDTNIANYYRGQGVFGNIVGGVADMVMAAYDTVLDFNFGSTAVLSPNAVPAMQRIGGDGLRVLRSMGFDNTELLADIEKETGGLPSTSTADMVALVESFDRNFDYKTWFNETIALDPTVRDGLLNYGVTEDLFKESRNSTHALMTLMSKMNVSDIQRRLSNYVPTTYQSIYGFAASFKDGLVGSLDTAAEIALEIGGTVAVDAAIGAGLLGAPTAGGAAPVGAVVGGVVGLAKAGQILYKGLSAAKKVMSSAWYLTGYGKLPRYAMQWGVIRTTGASALVGATANSLIDYVGQKENIALANSLYFYNPDMQATVSMDEVVGAAAAGALFGASLGMVGHVISTVAVRGNNAAARNAFAQQGMDPAFAPQQRNPFQRTADNIAAFRNRKAVAIQDPIAGAIQTAVSKGVDPTVVDINAAARTTSTAIDAASVASTPKDAANLPDHSLNRRQANEPMRAYTIRAVMGKFVTSVNDLLDADSAGGRFSQLTPREQYLTLLRTEDHMRDFSTMTDIETDLNNKVAGRPEQMRIIDPVTGRSSSPAANVAKLYGELDAAKSTLEKTISKEDRADATLAHKNGTELAPRTISSAVDKAASNVRGIMENASEGRHNPSTATGPKVEPQATTGVPAGENAAQGTTAPALPTQKKVDEITQDTAEDMSLLTDQELADSKTVGAIERNVTRQLFGGQKEHTLRSLSRGLAKARKLSLEQQGKITSTLDSPRSFIQQATGNPTYIKNFYDRLEALVGLGHITDIDRRIILASTVNTPFNSNVAAKISDMGTRGDDRASTSLQGDIKIGKLDTSVAGNTRVENVLHEIGHVEELHAYGQSLMDLRKLFTSEQAFLDAAQQVLGTDKFNKYYIAGNTQELMAQVKAKMMIDEVRLAVFLKTTNSTAVEKTLLAHALRIGTSLIEVFTSLKLSKVDAEDGMYSAVKEILSKLETGAKPLMTRIVYQQRVGDALKRFPTGKLTPEQKVAFAKELNAKISEDFTKNSAELKDMLFTKDEVESLHALTAHSDGSIDPIRLDAYLNVKREGITVKAKVKFAKTFQSYVEINQRYLASTTDIYIASMKENGYKAVPANPIVMDASLSKRDQIAALREYHRELAPDEMVVTPSYMDVTFDNFNGDLALQFLIDSSTEPTVMFAPNDKPSVAYTPELVVQRLAFLSTNLKDAPATAADFKKAMQGMLGMNDELFDSLAKVKGEVSLEQMADYHQMVIRRVVKNLMEEKIAVGPEGVRRLNLIEREMNPVRASKQIAKTKEIKIERAQNEVVDMPEGTVDSTLYPNNPMNEAMLENFWSDSGLIGKQVLARLGKSVNLQDGTVFTSLADKMMLIEAKGVSMLKDANGETRSRNALINYIVLSVQRDVYEGKGKVSRAGLTPASWSEFLAVENDIISTTKDGGEQITFNGTPMQHMAAEKKKDSLLYQRFVKAYSKASMVVDETGTRAGATATKSSEPAVSQVKAEGFSIMLDYATRLDYNLFSTRDGGWQKFVAGHHADGKSYDEIVALGKESGFSNKKAGNVADAIDAIRRSYRKMMEEKTGISTEGMTDDQVQASGVLDSIEELAKAADSARETAPEEDLAPERKSSSEILAETEKSATEQTNSDELTAALDTKEPTSQPVIAPEGSKGPVTAVVQVDGEAVGPLTPHVTPKTAEAVAKNPKTPKARFTSSTPKKVVVFTTGDARAMLKATGNVGKLFFASMKTMEGLLNALPKSALKDTDIAATIKILKKMIAAGEEKAAVAKFLALMKHLDIEAVKVIDPKDGRTVMNFIFAEQAWSYGGISRFKAAPKKAKPAAKTAAPKTAEPKTAEPKTAEAAPVDTPTEAAPDGTQVPVLQPKEVPSNEIAGGTVVPVVSEHDRIVTGLTEGNEALRDGGVDATSFTALFKKFVRSLSKDAKKKLGTVLPEEFKDLFMKFVELNAAIMHDNRTIFGDHKIVQKFWKQVDTMLAVEDGLQMKDTMRVRLTMKEIYAMAAAQVSTKQHRFLPPLTHENITIKNGKFGLRDVSKETQGVLARRDTGPIIAYTPEEIAARKAAAKPAGPIGPVTPPKQPKRPPTVEEILDETFNPENDPKVAAEAEAILQDSDRLDSIFKRVAASYSQLLRQNNLVSWFIGGSERANRNRWRAFMSKAVGAIQHASKLGITVRAMDAKVRFFAMFMDDSRAMTGQLVSPDGTPVRSAAKSKQEAVMFTANLTRIHHALAAEAAVLKMTPAERKMLQRLQIEAWQRKTTPTAQEMSAALGGKDFGKMAGILENYRKEMLHLNTEMLKLEEKTGWRTVTKNGKPVEADAYLPVQLHIQKLMSVMGDNKAYENLLRSIIATRRAGKMADSMLDKNTLITMGIMNLEDNSKFYTQDRTFALTDNITLDADTLKKLKKYETTTTESKDFTKTLGENGRDFFIIQEGGNRATVYMMPTETKHLSDADLKKYYDTVSGDQTHVTKTWKNELDNKDLVSVEMKELLDFKSRQGRYHHTKNTMVNNRPTIDANHHDEAFSTVRNFSVDELISNKELFEVSRTDLHAAYQNFSRYRMFDLLFQESIDQLAGSTGLRPKEFFRLIEEKIKADADKLSQGMSIDSRAAIQKDIDDGMGRLVWQYAEYNGTISRSGSESRVGQNIARTVRGIATTSSGLGYGLSQSPETTMEILKNMPQTKGLSVPVGGFRYLTSLLKFWDRKDSATKMQVGDLITSLEEYSKDHSTHFNEGIADIDFDTDLNSPYRAIWNSGRNSEGMTGQMADFFQRTGQTVVLAGGVTDGTNLARYYGKARHVRDLTAMMRDGKLKEFLRLRALPENRAAMQKLLEGSFASAAEERKLWKMHKSLARQAKGLDPFLALKAIKVGLDNPAKLEAMMYGMNAANALDGVLDFRDLHMVYRDLKNMKSPPIDPEVYRAAATDFQYGVEALIRKRTVTHGFGLNKNLSVFNTQDEVGKLVNTLTSYMRSWFDDVALNAPERGAVGLMFGGILSVAVVETMISLLREWMSGREMEDMIAELENDPYEYVLKFVSRMPIFGVMTPVLEGILKTAKYMSGGAQSGGSGLIDTLSQVGGGSPNIGINSAMSMLKTTGEAGTDLVTGAMEGDTQLMAKGALRVPGHFFNKTIYAAPVRVMEEAMDLDDKHTAQFIIDGLQKKPYRYLSQQRGGRRGGSSRAAPQSPVASPVTTQTMPSSAALRNAQRPEMGRQVKEYVAPAPPSKPNSGVSERLGKLLDNPSYTPTPPM